VQILEHGQRAEHTVGLERFRDVFFDFFFVGLDPGLSGQATQVSGQTFAVERTLLAQVKVEGLRVGLDLEASETQVV
jgi:hypothetical protein